MRWSEHSPRHWRNHSTMRLERAIGSLWLSTFLWKIIRVVEPNDRPRRRRRHGDRISYDIPARARSCTGRNRTGPEQIDIMRLRGCFPGREIAGKCQIRYPIWIGEISGRRSTKAIWLEKVEHRVSLRDEMISIKQYEAQSFISSSNIYLMQQLDMSMGMGI